MTLDQPMYPLQPLLDATGFTFAELRRKCPMNGSTYRLALDRGLLADQADRWAVRCDLHPSLVWSDWGLVPCADERCGVLFAPTRPAHRYCTDRCRLNATQRRWTRAKYQDPAWAAAERARSRAYYAECRSYVRSRQERARRNIVHETGLIYTVTPDPPQTPCGEVAA